MAKKGFIKDLNNIEILPITRGELVLDSSGNLAFRSTEFLATNSLPGLMSKEDKAKLDKLNENGDTIDLVSATTDGLAPKIGTAAASTVTTQADEWVLTSTKGATPTWRKLPTNAFLNYYRPILVNGTSLLGNNNTALNIAAGTNINLTTDAGKVTINNGLTKLSQLTDDILSGKYLPLTGGTLTGNLTIGSKSNQDFNYLLLSRLNRGVRINNTDSNAYISFGTLTDANGLTLEKILTFGDSGLRYSPDASTYYNVLHGLNTYIQNGVITINGISITPITSHQSLSNYVTLDTNLTITGAKIFSNNSTHTLVLNGTAVYSTLQFKTPNYVRTFGINKDGNLFVTPSDNWNAEYLVWHAGNDGHASGLDADTLDGKHLNKIFSNEDWSSISGVTDANQPLFGAYYFGGTTQNMPNTYGQLIAFNGLSDGYGGMQLFSHSNKLHYRHHWNDEWGEWKQIAFTDYNGFYNLYGGISLIASESKIINLNDYKTPGTFNVKHSSSIPYVQNIPVNKAGMLLVILPTHTEGYLIQLYNPYNSNEKYLRYIDPSTSWSEWKLISTDLSTYNAPTADKVKNSLILRINSGSTEGTNKYTYDGSTAKTINIIPKDGIGYGVSAGVLNLTNAGVRSIATGTTDGTISVNTNGTSANVAIKGLDSAAYTSSDSYVRLGYLGSITDVVDLYSKLKPYFGNYCVSITKLKDERGYWGHLLSKFQNPDLGLYGVDGCALFLSGSIVERWYITGKNTTDDPLVYNKYKIYDEGNLGVVSSSTNGLAPKVINTNTAIIGNAYYILASTNGSATPSWYKLPANAFSNTTYTFTNGTSGNFTVTPLGGTAQTVSIGKPATAGTADATVKLQTKRKLWGLDFDGSADVSGNMTGVGVVNSIFEVSKGSGNAKLNVTSISSDRDYLSLYVSSNTSTNTTTRPLVIQHGYGNVGIGVIAPSEKLEVNGNVKATSFIGNLDGNYVNKLTGYTKATSASDLVTTDTLNIALGKLEYKAGIAYSWYRTITEDDTDEIINKWDEVVDFVNNLAIDISEEFVTRKTSLIITGLKNFNTDTNTKPLRISRGGLSTEVVAIGVNDSQAIFEYTNDEKANSYVFKMVNTDTEGSDGSGANTSQVTFTGNSAGSSVTATTFIGKLSNTLTFSAGAFAAKTYNNSLGVTVNIPTHTSHLTNNSGFLTQHLSLANYVTLNTNLTISGLKTFNNDVCIVNNKSIHFNDSNGEAKLVLGVTTSNTLLVGHSMATSGYNTAIRGQKIYLQTSSSMLNGLTVNEVGNVGILQTSPKCALDVFGEFRMLSDKSNGQGIVHKILVYKTHPYGLITRTYGNGSVSLLVLREADDSETFNLLLQPLGGKVGIGTSTINSDALLHVNGNTLSNKFIKSGGTSSQFLKADGSVDSNKYLINTHATHTSAYYRNVTVNDTSYAFWSHNSNAAFTIYAPSTAGTKDLVLLSNGSGAPYWTNLSNLKISSLIPTTILSSGSSKFNYVKFASINLTSRYSGMYAILKLTHHFTTSTDYGTSCDLYVHCYQLDPLGTAPRYTIKTNNDDSSFTIVGIINYSETFSTLDLYVHGKAWTYLSINVLKLAGNNIINIGTNIETLPSGTQVIPLKTGHVEIANSVKNALTFSAGTFATKTYDGSSAITVNIPTKTSHLTNDSGYLTSRGYWADVAVSASSSTSTTPTFGATVRLNSSISGAGSDVILEWWRGANASWRALNTGGILKFQSNYTSSAGSYYDCFNISYNTGNTWIKGLITASGFIKSGSSDSYVLLGAGGHKALSDFMLKSEELTNNLTTITKSLTVTADWMDTGIKYTDLPANGTYVVQVSVEANDGTGSMYYCYWSGIMSWYRNGTNDSESDEIILHRSGHGYGNTIYLRTIMTTSTDGRHLRLLIAANKNIGAAYTYTFKFKRII